MESVRALALLRAGVPLTLLMDLWPATGPDSGEIMRRESAVSDAARSAA